jgi:DNA-binding FadR family transcriptional regulator
MNIKLKILLLNSSDVLDQSCLEMNVKNTLTEKIIKKLQDDLAFGVYKPGNKIPTEPQLMQLYGAGRSTIREAVKTLENVGILTVKRGSGTFVNLQIEKNVTEDIRMNRQRLKEVNDVRYLLEREILIQAIRYRNNNNIEEITEALSDRKKSTLEGRFQQALDADIRFHVGIAKATHNEILEEQYRYFTIRLREYFQSRDQGNISHFALVHGLHEVLLKNIINRNEEEGLRTLDKLLNNNYWRLGYAK